MKKRNRNDSLTKSQKPLSAVMIMFVLVFLGAFVFWSHQTQAQSDNSAGGGQTPPPVDISLGAGATASADQVSQVGSQVLALLAELKNIKLDGSIFNDPVFKSLQDHSVNIPPELKGRPNPFDAIGAGLSTPIATTSKPVKAGKTR